MQGRKIERRRRAQEGGEERECERKASLCLCLCLFVSVLCTSCACVSRGHKSTESRLRTHAKRIATHTKAAVVLADHDEEVQKIAFAYGKHIGLAFQLVDDVLDFEGDFNSLGKPG